MTLENYKYIQALDIIENEGKFYLNDEDLQQKLNPFMIDNHMDFGKLVEPASKGYPKYLLNPSCGDTRMKLHLDKGYSRKRVDGTESSFFLKQ